jgi:hypothetical protein
MRETPRAKYSPTPTKEKIPFVQLELFPQIRGSAASFVCQSFAKLLKDMIKNVNNTKSFISTSSGNITMERVMNKRGV